MEEDDDAAASVAAPAGQFALSRTLVSDGEPVRSLACLGPPPPPAPRTDLWSWRPDRGVA